MVFSSGLYRGHSLHCNHPTLRLRVALFNENHHAISIHGPRKKSMIRTERVSAVVYVCRGPKSVGGNTLSKHAHAQSQYCAVKSDQ